jgi:RNA polymerase sigma-70 factor (ECF subfamily)
MWRTERRSRLLVVTADRSDASRPHDVSVATEGGHHNAYLGGLEGICHDRGRQKDTKSAMPRRIVAKKSIRRSFAKDHQLGASVLNDQSPAISGYFSQGSFGIAPSLEGHQDCGGLASAEWLAPRGDAEPRVSPALSFDKIYRAYFRDVCRWVRALGGPEAEREDLVQDVFVTVHRRLHSFDGQNLPGWLYQITRHRVRDHRRLRWFRIFRGSTEADGTLVSPSAGPEVALGSKQKERLLTSLLGKLPESQRSAFFLFEIEGYSGEEIASLQGVPISTVRARIYRARGKLVAQMKRLRD